MPTMIEITRRSRERKLEAWRLRQAGKTFREIGEHFDVCAQTAKQMSDAGQRISNRASLKSAEKQS